MGKRVCLHLNPQHGCKKVILRRERCILVDWSLDSLAITAQAITFLPAHFHQHLVTYILHCQLELLVFRVIRFSTFLQNKQRCTDATACARPPIQAKLVTGLVRHRLVGALEGYRQPYLEMARNELETSCRHSVSELRPLGIRGLVPSQTLCPSNHYCLHWQQLCTVADLGLSQHTLATAGMNPWTFCMQSR